MVRFYVVTGAHQCWLAWLLEMMAGGLWVCWVVAVGLQTHSFKFAGLQKM